MFFHIFRHIQTDERVGRIKQVERQLFDQLGLADAGRTDEQEGRGLTLGTDAGACAADRSADGIHRLILSDDMCLEAAFHIPQAYGFLRGDLGSRDTGPDLDN